MSFLGIDRSGNGHHWDVNNLTASDQMVGTPTNNFATLNPLAKKFTTLSEGNLKAYGSDSMDWGTSGGTMIVSSGKWYVENLPLSGYPQRSYMGFMDSFDISSLSGGFQTSIGLSYNYNGNFIDHGSSSAYGASWVLGDIISCALDLDSGTITFYKNGVSQGVAKSGLTGSWVFATSQVNGTDNITNFGQDSSFAGNKTAQSNTDDNGYGDFYYSPPTDYLALCTQNLDNPAAGLWSGGDNQAFNTVTYAGTNNEHTLDVGFQPDFSWFKVRNLGTQEHALFDSLRGNERLMSDTTNAEESRPDDFTEFTSTGVTIKGSSTFINNTSYTYVAWNWKANGSDVLNENGTIDSQVSANTDAGFSIVSYTGNGTAGATIGHGLGTVPEMMIVKRRDATASWQVYHSTQGNGKFFDLHASDAVQTATNRWNDTSPTSSLFSLGDNTNVNASSGTYIAYCFHSVDGYSKVGSYTGNGSSDGTFVYTGFRPAYVMLKKTSAAGDWAMLDAKRNTYNVVQKMLRAQGSDVEADTSNSFTTDFTSNGFKCRATNGNFNASGGTYIYIAFAETPFKYSNAR